MALDYAGGALTNAFSSGTSGITGGGFGSFAGGSFSAGGGGGLFSNPVGLALAGGQLAFGIGQMLAGNSAQEQQQLQQIRQTTYNNIINQYRVEQQNKQIAEAFGAKIDFVRNQIENNFTAAQASWVSEQMRLNEVYDTAAYKSQAMQKLLKESLGTAAAREVYGKSARRGALVSTLGAYGRTRSQLVDQLMSETVATKMRMERTEEQKRAQDKLAISQVAVLPSAATFTPTSIPSLSGPGFGQTAMQLAGIGMQAFQTGLSVTPKEMKFLGIQGLA